MLLLNETSISTMPLTKMTIDTGNSEPVIPKAVPYCDEELPMG